MGYDMYNQYNQYNMYNNPMYYGQNPMMQPQMGYQMGMPQQQNQPKEESGGIVGLNPKKGKKKKQATQDNTQPSNTIQQQPPMYQQNYPNYQQQQFYQPQYNQPQPQNNQPKKETKLQTKAPATQNKPANKQQSGNQNKPQTHSSNQQKKTDSGVQNKKTDTAVEKAEKDLDKLELVEDSFEGQMIQVDTTKQPVSLVFVGHVDAGKSTISGSLLFKLGQIDERTIEKYQREAKVNNRESWFMAYIMDINEEEREKGKTVEIGKAFFETSTKRFTLLDAPGHAGYIPNLLQGACQADFAGLVIAAKKGEFEAGFDKNGSTREHALLLKALGVNQLIVIVNKMDEETVKWSEDRYNFIQKQLKPFLKACGYNIEKNVHWVPISGLTGDNLINKVDPHKCPWYKGPTLIELLDSIEVPQRNDTGPVRLPILDRYKENSLYLMGKLENGTLKYGQTYTLMPKGIKVEVGWLFDTEERGVPYAKPGESVRIRCKGLDNEEEVSRGNVLCSNDDLCAVFDTFEAEIQVLELQEQQIITNGFKCILHFHTYIEECTIDIKCEIDRSTKTEKKVKFVRSQARIKAYVKTNTPLCGEKYEKFPSLGRFSMRYEGQTIAIGKILKYKPYKSNK